MKDKTGGRRSLRVAVVGAGIGGVSAACSLLNRGVDVMVFEQATALGEIGAGVLLLPNGLRQLERMEFGEALAAVGAKIGDGSQYYRADGTVVGPIVTSNSMGWNGVYGMHRADLLNALAAKLPAETIRLRHRCVGIVQAARSAQLQFAHGDSFDADIVIAADGIHSTLQKYAVESGPPEYSGVRAYRGLISREKLPGWPEVAHMVWMGDGKHFITYPVRSGRLLNYVGFVPTKDETIESWSAAGDVEELRHPSMDGIPELSDCSKRSRVAIGGVSMIAVRLCRGQAGGLYCWVTPPTRCFPISAKGPIRRLKMASPWRSFSKGETRTKSQIFCRDMKYFDAPEPTVFKLKRGKPGFVTTPSTTAWRSVIAKSQNLGCFANHFTTTTSKRPPSST